MPFILMPASPMNEYNSLVLLKKIKKHAVLVVQYRKFSRSIRLSIRV